MKKIQHLVGQFLFVLLPLIATNSYAEFTKGSFDVGPDGSTSYLININTPPGTGGMAPKISLQFNSNAGNGLLGLGWSISGVPFIQRCPKSILIDGRKGGINYDNEDKFCLDGERLISTSSVYGADQTEYRTVDANFSKIVSYGAAGNGPAYFKVFTKAGLDIEYGNTADSRVEASNISTVRLWAANKIIDKNKNYINFIYSEDNVNGEAYINRINYTGNDSVGLIPYASVRFFYENRPDVTSDYQSGSLIKSSKRLTSIKVYYGEVLTREYKISYLNTGTYHYSSNNIADGSLVNQIQECTGQSSNFCKEPVVFNWSLGSKNSSVFASAQAWTGLSATAEIVASGDINGDGLDDIVFRDNISGFNGSLYYSFSTGTSYTSPTFISSQTAKCMRNLFTNSCIKYIWPEAFLGDVNGDGKADFLSLNYVRISSGNNFGPELSWLPAGSRIAGVGDVNGDNLADVVYRSSSAETGYEFEAPLLLSTSLGTSLTAGVPVGHQYLVFWDDGAGGTWRYWVPVVLGDVNGDGLADLINFGTSKTQLSNSVGFKAAVSGEYETIYNRYGFEMVKAGDINGDGKIDVIVLAFTNGNTLNPAYASGKEFLLTGGVFPSNYYAHAPCASFDEYSGATGCSYINHSISLIDVNGDGMADFVNGNLVSLSQIDQPDLLTNIYSSGGMSISINYKKISDTSTYIPDIDSSYPIFNTQRTSPIYVVSSVSTSDGIGGSLTSSYQYGGLKMHVDRGSLGFRWVKTIDADSNAIVINNYRQDYPFIGLVSSSEKRQFDNNNLISTSNNYYTNSPVNTGSATSQFPYLSQSIERTYELTGELVATTTTTNSYDSFGNVLQASVDSGDGHVKTTINQYHNDTVRWILGRLLKSTVTTTTP